MTGSYYTRLDIERAIALCQNLCPSGFRDAMPRPDDTPLTDETIVRQVNACARFIAHMCAPTKTICRLVSSYGWKHIAENVLGQHVCNGAFIAAAILAGYRVARDTPRSPNAVFNMRVSSATLRAYIDGGQVGRFSRVWEPYNT
jgi:hypothetical protein